MRIRLRFLILARVREAVIVANDICSQTAFDSCMSSSFCLLSGVVRLLSTSVALGIRNRTTDWGYLAAVTPHTVVSLYYARLMAQILFARCYGI